MSLEVTEITQEDGAAPTPLLGDELTPLEKKVAMLYFAFGPETLQQQKLVELVGQQYLDTFIQRVADQRELWRFRFETEINEHMSEVQIAADMLEFIRRAQEKERVKSRYM